MFEPVLIRPCLENYPVPPVSTPWKGTDQTIDPGTFLPLCREHRCNWLPIVAFRFTYRQNRHRLLRSSARTRAILLFLRLSAVFPSHTGYSPSSENLRADSNKNKNIAMRSSKLSSSGAILLMMLLSSKQPRQKKQTNQQSTHARLGSPEAAVGMGRRCMTQ